MQMIAGGDFLSTDTYRPMYINMYMYVPKEETVRRCLLLVLFVVGLQLCGAGVT